MGVVSSSRFLKDASSSRVVPLDATVSCVDSKSFLHCLNELKTANCQCFCSGRFPSRFCLNEIACPMKQHRTADAPVFGRVSLWSFKIHLWYSFAFFTREL
jgi:hypothetical protein